MLASNHLAFMDSVVITLVARRSVSFMAKVEYFTGTGFKGWLSRSFFTSVGAVPVDRESSRAAQEALDAGLEVLNDGNAFSIYPEGTRSRDGRLYRGRTGVAWLALTAGVPVVPVALKGTEKLQTNGSRMLRLARVDVEFGAPIDVSVYGPATSGRARRLATDAIMLEIARMSGQERADTYNEPPPESVRERAARIFKRERL